MGTNKEKTPSAAMKKLLLQSASKKEHLPYRKAKKRKKAKGMGKNSRNIWKSVN